MFKALAGTRLHARLAIHSHPMEKKQESLYGR
jgi:hypothetical protein